MKSLKKQNPSSTDVETCSECGRVLLISGNRQVCCFRHCPEYDHDESETVSQEHKA